MVPHGRAGASEAALIRCSSVSPLKAVGVVKTRIARRGGAVPRRAAPTSNRRCCVTVPPRDTAPAACVRPRRARAHCGGVATNSRRERAEMSWSPGCKDTGEDKARYDPSGDLAAEKRERTRALDSCTAGSTGFSGGHSRHPTAAGLAVYDPSKASCHQ